MCFPNDRARTHLPTAVDSPNLAFKLCVEDNRLQNAHLIIDVCLNNIDEK